MQKKCMYVWRMYQAFFPLIWVCTGIIGVSQIINFNICILTCPFWGSSTSIGVCIPKLVLAGWLVFQKGHIKTLQNFMLQWTKGLVHFFCIGTSSQQQLSYKSLSLIQSEFEPLSLKQIIVPKSHNLSHTCDRHYYDTQMSLSRHTKNVSCCFTYYSMESLLL